MESLQNQKADQTPSILQIKIQRKLGMISERQKIHKINSIFVRIRAALRKLLMTIAKWKRDSFSYFDYFPFTKTRSSKGAA